jgi:hypothetical protein
LETLYHLKYEDFRPEKGPISLENRKEKKIPEVEVEEFIRTVKNKMRIILIKGNPLYIVLI